MKKYRSLYAGGLLCAALLSLSACDADTTGSGENIDNGGDTLTKSTGLLLDFATDYASGELRWMSLDSSALAIGSMPFNSDSRIAVHGKNLFVLERYGSDNVNCIDLSHIGEPSAVRQVELEDGANPYDAAVAGGKGWLALWGVNYVQAFDTSSCALGAKIDLSAYGQAGEVGPHAAAVVASGDTLMVLLQRLKAYEPDKSGLLVRIDARTGSVLDTISLLYHNPVAAIVHEGKLLVASSGSLMGASTLDATRGVEIVDLATKTTRSLVDGVALGGGAAALALDSKQGVLYVSVFAAYKNQPVKPVNLSTGMVGAALPNVADSFGELAFDSVTARLFIGDRTYGSEALRVYEGGVLTALQASGALAPSDLQVARW